MARKKNRSARQASTTVKERDQSTPSPSKTEANGQQPSAKPERLTLDSMKSSSANQRTIWERMAIKISRWVGSLQVAVLLLITLVVVLAVGTMAESWYTGKLARELVYQTWWFNLLMAALFLNIFFAAAKKWPWKRHQTGFVITHIGLLLLISGGVINSFFGVDSLLQLASVGPQQVRDVALDPDHAMIKVSWPNKYGKDRRDYEFTPGSLTWRSEPSLDYQRDLDGMLTVLDFLAHPFPRGWSANLDHGATLEVLNYFTHVRPDAYRQVRKSEETREETSPAVHFELTNPKLGPAATFDSWLGADSPRNAVESIGDRSAAIGSVEIISSFPVSDWQAEEFENPPAPNELGRMGQLVIHYQGQTYRRSVEPFLGGGTSKLGDSGWSIQFRKYYANYAESDLIHKTKEYDPTAEMVKKPEYPVITVDLYPTGQQAEPTKLSMIGRYFAGRIIPQQGELPRGMELWYHPPDYRFGESHSALIQFVFDENDQLHYRTFSSGNKEGLEGNVTRGFGLEKHGILHEHEPVIVWRSEGAIGAMEWQLTIFEKMLHGVASPLPVNEIPGIDTPQTQPAIRCRLTLQGESKEFWIFKSTDGQVAEPTTVRIGDEVLQFQFDYQELKLPFKVKLLRAEQTSDPGTDSPASYSSYVQIIDGQENRNFDYLITMNEPLDYRGYKLFQTGIDTQVLGPDRLTLKPRSLSTFTVSSDPGLLIKYLGSICLAVGIATMFYMRAYFFKPRGRKQRVES